MGFFDLILRGVQLIFAIILLGLFGDLVANQVWGSPAAIIGFALFCAAWGALASFVGIAANFVDSLKGLVMLALDGASLLFYLSGSIALAALIGVGSCTNDEYLVNHHDTMTIGLHHVRYTEGQAKNYAQKRCEELQAGDAFLFFQVAAFAATLVLGFFGRNK